ncbi:MAG: PAS domain S-box protein [Candidatus Micrarchaeia archaeon]
MATKKMAARGHAGKRTASRDYAGSKAGAQAKDIALCIGNFKSKAKDRRNGMMLFSQAIDNAFDHIIITDPAGKIIYANKAASRVTGYPHSEIMGSTPSLWKSKSTPDSFYRKFWKTIRDEKKVFRGEITNRRKNGETYNAEINVAPFLDGEGKVLGFLGIERDVTGQKEMVDKLAFQAQMLSQIQDIILILDNRRRIVYANGAASSLLGIRIPKDYGRPMAAFFKYRWDSKEDFREAGRLLAQGKAWRGESDNWFADGRKARMEVSLKSMLNGEGKMSHVLIVLRDISEKKKAQREHEENERLYRYMFEDISIPKVLVDPKTGRLIDANKAATDFYGYTKEKVVGRDVSLLGLDDPASVKKAIKDSWEKKAKFLTGRHRIANGEIKDVEIYPSPIKIGNTEMLLFIIHDVTDKKTLELKNATIIETSQDGFAELDRKGAIRDANESYCRMTGYAKEELVGMNIHDMDATETRGQTQRRLKEIYRRKAARFETVQKRKDGTTFPTEVSVTYVEKPDRMFVFMRDITERKKAEEGLREQEEKFREVFTESPIAIEVFDREGRLIGANPSAESLFGFKYSKGDYKFSFFDDPNMNPKRRRQLEKEKTVSYEIAVDFDAMNKSGAFKNTKSGMVRLEARIHKLAEGLADQSGIGYMAQFLDVSDRARAERMQRYFNEQLQQQIKSRTRELEQEKERVEQLTRVKDNIIRDISHELKTPLSVIMGNIELLKISDPNFEPGKVKSMLDMLARNSERLRDSINQILDASRITTLAPRNEIFSLKKIISDVVEEHRPLAMKKGLRFGYECPEIGHEGDQLLIGLAIKNLVSNAIKFTDSGSVSIEAWQTPGMTFIKVSDTGRGMTKEQKESLFVKYFKADPKVPGSGIGLVTANEIVLKHMGSIEVETERGRGTTFTITLPRRERQAKAARAEPAKEVEAWQGY